MVIKAFIIFGIYILIGLGFAIVFERHSGGLEDGDILAAIIYWPFVVVILIIEFMIWIVRKAGGRGL